MAPAPGGRRRNSGGINHNPYSAVAMVVEDEGATARNRNRRSAPTAAAAAEEETAPVVNAATSTAVAARGQMTNDDRRPTSRPQNHVNNPIDHQARNNDPPADPPHDPPADPPHDPPQDDSVPVPKHITVDQSTDRRRPSKVRNSRSSSGSSGGGDGSSRKSNKNSTHFLLKLAGACEKHAVYHPELSSANKDGKKKRKMLRPPPLAPTTSPSSSSSASPGAGGIRHHQTMLHHHHHRVPDHCTGDIKICRQILPRLKEKMPPPLPPLPPTQRQHEHDEDDDDGGGRLKGVEQNPSKLQKKRQKNRQLLGDVVHFCQFVETTLFGYYCPHMAELFGWGRDVHVVLDNVQFLIRHLLYNPEVISSLLDEVVDADVDNKDAGRPKGSGSGDDTASQSSPKSSFDTVCDTIAYLLSFIVNDQVTTIATPAVEGRGGYGDDGGGFDSIIYDSKTMHRLIFLDLIYSLEDCALLQLQQQQRQVGGQQRHQFCQSRIELFAEVTASSPKSPIDKNDKSLYFDILDQSQLYVLQTILLKVVPSFLKETAPRRYDELTDPSTMHVSQNETRRDGQGHDIQLNPDHVWLESGNVDLMFPPDTISGNLGTCASRQSIGGGTCSMEGVEGEEILPSLQIGLKAIFLDDLLRVVPASSSLSKREIQHIAIDQERRAAAADLAILLFRDWHINPGPSIGMMDMSILVARAVSVQMQKGRRDVIADQVNKITSKYESRLAILLNRSIVSPPTIEQGNKPGLTSNIALAVLRVLLDSLKEVQKDVMRSRNGQSSSRGLILDTMILGCIHSIISPSFLSSHLMAAACSHCMGMGLFQIFFDLVASLSTIRFDHQCGHVMLLWTERSLSSLLAAAAVAASSSTPYDSSLFDPFEIAHQRALHLLDSMSDNIDSPVTKTRGNTHLSGKKRSTRHDTEVATKARKKRATESGSTKITLDDASSGVNKSTPPTWYDGFGHFVSKCIISAERLDVQLRGSNDLLSDELSSVCLMTSGLRICFFLFQCTSSVSVSDVLRRILCSLESCCGAMQEQLKGSIIPSSLANIVNQFVDCGLLASLFSRSIPLESQHSFDKSVKSFLRALSLLCSQVVCGSPASTIETSYRSLVVNSHKFGIPSYLTVKNPIGSFAPTDVYGVISATLLKDEQVGSPRSTSIDSLVMLDSLNGWSKVALVSALNPIWDSPRKIDQSDIQTTNTGIYAADVLRSAMTQWVKVLEEDPTMSPNDGSNHVAASLHVLPLLSERLRDISEQRSQNMERGRGGGRPNEFSSFELIYGIITPVLESKASTTNRTIQHALLFVLNYLHTLTRGSSTENLNGTTSNILSFIQQRHFRLPTETECNAFDSNLEEISRQVVHHVDPYQSTAIVRYLLWMCLARKWVVTPPNELRELLELARSKNDQSNNDIEITTGDLMAWTMKTTFADHDRHLRLYFSSEMPRLLFGQNFGILFARFASADGFQIYKDCLDRWDTNDEKDELQMIKASEGVATSLFEEIDRLLESHCGFSETEVSLTMTKSDASARSQSTERAGHLMSNEHTASKVLLSLCCSASLNDPLGRSLLEKATIRLERMWAGSSIESAVDFFPEIPSTPSRSALGFAALSSLSNCRDISVLFSQDYIWTGFPSATFFCDVLILKGNKTPLEQYCFLEQFIKAVVATKHGSLLDKESTKVAKEIADASLDAILAQFITERDYELLQKTAAFFAFLNEKFSWNKKRGVAVGSRLVGRSDLVQRHNKLASVNFGKTELEAKTKELVLSRRSRILPLVFMNDVDIRQGSPLFFLKRVTESSMDLSEMVSKRKEERVILKNIAWEMARNPHRIKEGRNALRTLALARIDEKTQRDQTTATNETRKLVTNHFMYILINVVQLNWNSRNLKEKAQSLRCFQLLLEFLDSSETPRYFTQVFATISIAIDEGNPLITLHAAKSLSKFVRLAMKDSIETVMGQLTEIIVLLIPIVDDRRQIDNHSMQQARNEAVFLIESLATPKNVEQFSMAFHAIPFLPSTPELDDIHKTLQEHGIDFCHLLAMPSSQIGSRRGSMSSDASLTDGSRASTSSPSQVDEQAVQAMKQRLELICSLIDAESVGVRKVAVGHLAGLLRSNRRCFHSFVDLSSSIGDYLTVVHANTQSSEFSSTKLVESLLRRCADESDNEIRILLAKCVGEVGAIAENRLGNINLAGSTKEDSLALHQWRLEQPPWHSRPAKYELKLVTKLLVNALKASTSSHEQLKIAFSIQQILVLLDTSDLQNAKNSNALSTDDTTEKKPEMGTWLKDQLQAEGVLETVEPYWNTELKEKDDMIMKSRDPPFFRHTATYVMWITSFCRWMIVKSKDCSQSRWKDFFYSCRTATRSETGLNVAEFMVPLLVLDRLCFGEQDEKKLIVDEFLLLLKGETKLMPLNDRQKALNAFFSVVDTLSHWADRETEDSCRSRRTKKLAGRSVSRQKSIDGITSPEWSVGNVRADISEFLDQLPLTLQARAASEAEMHARALLLLEKESRGNLVDEIYESIEPKNHRNECSLKFSLKGIDLTMMKKSLASLGDCETMVVVGEEVYDSSPVLDVSDRLLYKQKLNDFEGSLRDYQRLLQVDNLKRIEKPELEEGVIRCLVETGRFEEVLSRTTTSTEQEIREDFKSYRAEASVRLGRWDALSSIVESNEKGNENSFDKEEIYRMATAKSMLYIHNKNEDGALLCLDDARNAVMQSLSSFARESYSRCYQDIVRLQCIREAEDAASLLCSTGFEDNGSLTDHLSSDQEGSWEWDGRLKLVAPVSSSMILSNRATIARLGRDPFLESSMHLEIGKQARKNDQLSMSERALTQAEAIVTRLSPSHQSDHATSDKLLDGIRTQYAKLRRTVDDDRSAFRILGRDSVDTAFAEIDENREQAKKLAIVHERERTKLSFGAPAAMAIDDSTLAERFARRLLRLSRWNVSAGLEGETQSLKRFKTVVHVDGNLAKGHFHYAKYLEKLVTMRLAAKDVGSQSVEDDDECRSRILCNDLYCQKYIQRAIMHYCMALKHDLKHVYQALPRLLSLWFDFTGIELNQETAHLSQWQETLNGDILKIVKSPKGIPMVAYYNVLPQLVSRVIHNNNDTALIVKSLLGRVLYTYPLQAMWHLAWLKGSKNADRRKIGDDIFAEAQKMHLAQAKRNRGSSKRRSGIGVEKNHDRIALVLDTSQSLFRYLKDLAMFDKIPKDSNTARIKPWRGAVDLTEFVPPVQAALAIPPTNNLASDRVFFSFDGPRMKTFLPRIDVMSSKARPKKLTVLMVPGTMKDGSTIIGEVHFLVKQEARGDLRKDSRVQDLNLVVNRLLSSASGNQSLLVRTFQVTCLSEDTGILEWVPSTRAMRSLVSQSYHPMASPWSSRRRGDRLTNLLDVPLRNAFDACQRTYVKSGNLTRATQMFEEKILQAYPPLLYWWFVRHFPDPFAWFEARQSFTRSAAAWSVIGHMIGLGDRHSENILVDTISGQIVHVDFDCIFDKGLNLPRPEIVPFRLTQNLIDAFGPTGHDGAFRSTMESVLSVLRDNKDTLLSVLEPFAKDPVIDWHRRRNHSSQQKGTNRGKDNAQSVAPKVMGRRAIKTLEQRLSGFYNLHNPNYRKIARSDTPHNDPQQEEVQIIPYSVQGQVEKLIREASSSTNLVQLYVGWMPWV